VTAATFTTLGAFLINGLAVWGIQLDPAQIAWLNTGLALIAPWVVWFIARRMVTPLSNPKDKEGVPLTSLANPTDVDGRALVRSISGNPTINQQSRGIVKDDLPLTPVQPPDAGGRMGL